MQDLNKRQPGWIFDASNLLATLIYLVIFYQLKMRLQFDMRKNVQDFLIARQHDTCSQNVLQNSDFFDIWMEKKSSLDNLSLGKTLEQWISWPS